MSNFLLNAMFKLSSMGDIFTKFTEWFKREILAYVVYYLYIPIYNVCSAIALMCDIGQNIYLQLMGLGGSTTPDQWYSGAVSGDILTDFLYNSNIQTVFRNLILVAIVLLLVFTVFAILKSEYAQDNTTKTQIVGRSVKALFTFFLVPALTFGGIYLSNQLLKTLYMAVTPNQAETISQVAFSLALSDANRAGYQINANGEITYNDKDFYDIISSENVNSINGGYFGTAGATTGNNVVGGDIAAQIDYALTHGVSDAVWTRVEDDGYLKEVSAFFYLVDDQSFHSWELTYYNPVVVFTYYDPFKINWLVFAGTLLFSIFFIGKITLGLISRIFNIVFLYAISPPIVAMMPLDNGKAFGSWKSSMIKHVLSAYGAVIGMNLFSVLCGVIPTLTFGVSIFNLTISAHYVTGIMQLIFMLVALQLASKFPNIIAGFIGSNEALAEGKGIAQGVADTAKKVVSAGVTVAAAAMTGGAAGVAFKQSAKLAKTAKKTKAAIDVTTGEDGTRHAALKDGYKNKKKFKNMSEDQLIQEYDSATNDIEKHNELDKATKKDRKQRFANGLKVISDATGISKTAAGQVVGEVLKGAEKIEKTQTAVMDAPGNRMATEAFTTAINSGLKSKIAENNEAIGKNNNKIDANNSNITVLNAKIDANNNNILDIKSKIAKSEEDLLSASSNKDKRKIRKEITRQKGALSTQESELNSNINERDEFVSANKTLQNENNSISQDNVRLGAQIEANKDMQKEVSKNYGFTDKMKPEAKKYVENSLAYVKQEEESKKAFAGIVDKVGFDNATKEELKRIMDGAMRQAFSKGTPEQTGNEFRKALEKTNINIQPNQIESLLKKFNENAEIQNKAKELLKQMADSDKKLMDEIKKMIEKNDKDGGNKK